jgi:hypothetical protein
MAASPELREAAKEAVLDCREVHIERSMKPAFKAVRVGAELNQFARSATCSRVCTNICSCFSSLSDHGTHKLSCHLQRSEAVRTFRKSLTEEERRRWETAGVLGGPGLRSAFAPVYSRELEEKLVAARGERREGVVA